MLKFFNYLFFLMFPCRNGSWVTVSQHPNWMSADKSKSGKPNDYFLANPVMTAFSIWSSPYIILPQRSNSPLNRWQIRFGLSIKSFWFTAQKLARYFHRMKEIDAHLQQNNIYLRIFHTIHQHRYQPTKGYWYTS